MAKTFKAWRKKALRDPKVRAEMRKLGITSERVRWEHSNGDRIETLLAKRDARRSIAAKRELRAELSLGMACTSCGELAHCKTGCRAMAGWDRVADGGGIRHNAGKLRVDLVPADVIAALAEVLGHACTQRQPPYPERNWERGMKWSDVVASLERHLLDVKMGRRLDPSGTGLKSTALLLCNAVFLCAYDIRGMHHLDDLEPFSREAAKRSKRRC